MAVRVDASGEGLTRSTSVPSKDSFTACGWAYQFSSAVRYRNLFSIGYTTYADHRLIGFDYGTMYLFSVGTDADNFASSPSATTWFWWYLKCNGSAMNGGWCYHGGTPTRKTFANELNSGGANTMFLATSSYDEYLDGRMAAVKVWDAVLTDAELDREMYQIRPVRMSNLNLWSPLQVNSLDYSGNGRNWTEGGTLTWEDGPPVLWGGAKYVIGSLGLVLSVSASLSPSASPSPSVAPKDGIAWGEQNPNAAEEAVTWQRWKKSTGGVIDISGDQDWGAAMVATGIPCLGEVIDTGDTSAKTFTVTRDKYATGSGAVTISIRGSNTLFAYDAGSPSWSTYTAPTNQSWRYVQLKMES